MYTIRKDIEGCTKRIVIKIGTQSLIESCGSIRDDKLQEVAADISALCANGTQVILVSSGAVAAGKKLLANQCNTLSGSRNPGKVPFSAVGQPHLFGSWFRHLEEHGLIPAQVLLTNHDLDSSSSRDQTAQGIESILESGLIPILNENDVVTNAKSTVGDNDQMAAAIAKATRADLLLILTGPDGVFRSDPSSDPFATCISKISGLRHSKNILKNLNPFSKSTAGRGGMFTKVQAAMLLQKAGIVTLLSTSECHSPVLRALTSENKGSIFLPDGAHKYLAVSDIPFRAPSTQEMLRFFSKFFSVHRALNKNAAQLCISIQEPNIEEKPPAA